MAVRPEHRTQRRPDTLRPLDDRFEAFPLLGTNVGSRHLPIVPEPWSCFWVWYDLEVLEVPSEEVLRAHHAYVASDSHPFKRVGRLRQAQWREKQGFPVGLHRGQPLGSRLKMPDSEQHLWNYLTDGIRDVVRAAVADPEKLIQAPRIYDDLLSSQPLCFNPFGELALDLDLASRVLRGPGPDDIERVTAIEFEHSPGRGDPRFTSNHSACDVYAEYTGTGGQTGFLGIEVKYTENMAEPMAKHRDRYDEIADGMGCFRPEERRRLRAVPVNQLWRDHLLAGSMLLDRNGPWEEGRFIVLYPRDNEPVATAVQVYTLCLSDTETFGTWTLEEFVDGLEAECAEQWVGEVRERYLGS